MTHSLTFPASRRDILRGGAALGLLAGLPPGVRSAHAQTAPPDGIIRRAIPRTGELVPALGLGTFLTFDVIPGQNRDHLEAVTRRYWEAGARVIDTSPLYGSGEYSVGDFLSEFGANGEAFIANKIWSTGEYLADESHARRSFEQSQGRLWRDRIDVLQCHSLVNVDAVVPLMKAWKKEGRVRYVGVTHFENPYHDLLLNWIERGDLDFVQVNYSIFNRAAERVLEAAAQRGVAVLTNMPLEKARLHKAVEGQALPAFAREIGAETWAQFFLKWVISHPAVTTTLCATSRPEHAAENVAALRGELPDREMRQRMVRHMETIPAVAQIAATPWYPGKRYPGLIARSQADIRART
jgi:diketogulonate reductase-like aldo/keto reductase